MVITNDFDLSAVVTYSGAASGSTPMTANGSTAVSFELSAPSTLTYSVAWSDGVQQGQRSISVDPLTDCVITPTTTPSTAPPTTVPPAETPTTAPPAPESVPAPTTVESTTTPTVLGAELVPEAAPPKAAAAPKQQLPATGSSDTVPLAALASGIIVAGALLVVVRRIPQS